MRCLIVDDSTVFLDAARRVLNSDDVDVVGVASNSVEALRCYHELQPDVVLIDVELGPESGFDVAEDLHRAASQAPCPMILISTHAAEDFAELTAASPADGFLAKAALSPAAIRSVLRGSSGIQEREHS
jgi:DNA-binding NarL/FixJ family response regulator